MRTNIERIQMFCDASSNPPVVAAVLVKNQQIKYCSANVPLGTMKQFDKRNDDQIMNLELYAILCGLKTFSAECFGCHVSIWTDNVGGECALKKQSAKACDHNKLVHAIWSCAIDLNCSIWFNRVPSALNIADGPTRPDENINCSVLHSMGAKQAVCELAEPYLW